MCRHLYYYYYLLPVCSCDFCISRFLHFLCVVRFVWWGGCFSSLTFLLVVLLALQNCSFSLIMNDRFFLFFATAAFFQRTCQLDYWVQQQQEWPERKHCSAVTVEEEGEKVHLPLLPLYFNRPFSDQARISLLLWPLLPLPLERIRKLAIAIGYS